MTSSPSSSIGGKSRTSSHKNAPLTPEGRKRLVERCRTRPIAHVAAEIGISRATASK
ncbi:transposase IS481 family protein [Actinorugispora endophytica]|uniref:Transposase IS481 family protein n=1 Tax=Actinorugispora endophytica TaxID=1605990 RepID=A0A4V3D938_9ACTN|nr:transposase IS481 family protein [Actinorugispora endophytica]